MDIYIPALAFFIDCIIGDPRTKLHPVIWIGSFISFLEKLLRHDSHTKYLKRIMGLLLVILTLGTCWLITGIIMEYMYNLGEIYGMLAGAIILSFMISPRSLAAAGREIRQFMQADNLLQARFKVGWIVGRDTEKLSVPEITRAVVETIAENTVDGIISPLFYFWLGGAPLAVLYRAVNTLDSMVGYKNDKYIDFGKAAARIDDIFNFIPARLTCLLILLASCLLRYDTVNAVKMTWRDAAKHPSPNGGYAEAAVAGALHVRLGGYNSYFGKMSFREYMGEPLEELQCIHIDKTIKIMYTATIIFIIISTFIVHIAGGQWL